MHIPGDFRPIDPLARKRAAEVDAKARAGRSDPPADAAGDGDAVAGPALGGLTREDVSRYVEILKQYDPASLHRIDNVRRQLADGSYTATSSELAQLLLGESGGPAA